MERLEERPDDVGDIRLCIHLPGTGNREGFTPLLRPPAELTCHHGAYDLERAYNGRSTTGNKTGRHWHAKLPQVQLKHERIPSAEQKK